MKILVFDKYLGYKVGGAQRSLHILLSSLSGDVKLLGCEVKNTYNAERFKLKNLSVERFGITEIGRFPYLEYWWNRGKIKKIISQEKADLLITQGLWGAIAVR